MPNINSYTPWSEMDLFDLRNEVMLGRSLGEIAEFMCRDLDEIEAKIAELNLQFIGPGAKQ